MFKNTESSSIMNLINDALAINKSVQVDNLNETLLQGSTAINDFSLWGLFLQADMLVKLVMIFLILASIWSWAIIFDKWILLRSIINKAGNFEKLFWSGQSLDVLYEQTKAKESHPMALVFLTAMHEWHNRPSRESYVNPELKINLKERIYQSMQIAVNKSLYKLDKNLDFLATVGSSAPFVGLFGTVWGIMVSFQSIAISKNTTLAVVAPGIAEALLATAFGLAAAIPAMVFYNKFLNQINKFSSHLDDFSLEIGSIMSRELDNMK